MHDPLTTKRHVRAWILYDVAAHGYGLMIPTVGFAIYFTSFVALGHPAPDALWSMGIATSLILAGLIAPWLGALADARGNRRALLAGATVVCAAATGLLPTLQQGDYGRGIALFIVAQVASMVAFALYNSFLPLIAPPARRSRVSGLAWGLSYLGGIGCFLLCLPFTNAGVTPEGAGRFALAFLVTAAFLLVLGLIAVAGLPAMPGTGSPPTERHALRRIRNTVRLWRSDREVPKFLLAYYLVNDAVVTVLFFAAIVLKSEFGMSVQQVLMLSIGLQLVAIPATIFFGWLGDRWGQRPAIYLALLLWAFPLGLLAFGEGPRAAVAIAASLGIVLGSTQSLFRSLFTSLLPVDRAAEYFGFHALAGRASSALGPVVFGLVSTGTGSQRIAMLSLSLFLIGGAVVLAIVRVPPKPVERGPADVPDRSPGAA
jgi:UMF1 family MFS transporter